MAAKVLTKSSADPMLMDGEASVAELRGKIGRLIADPELWLDTPHPLLAEHRPAEFLHAGRDKPLRDLVAAIEYGQFA